MILSVYSQVHDALVTLLTDALDVPVVDTIPNTKDYLPDVVIVGGSIDPMDPASGEFSSDVHTLGMQAQRRETGFIRVGITSQGDATFVELRERCFAIGDQIADVLRDSVTFGVTAGDMCPQLTEIKARHTAGVNSYGPFVDLVLYINFMAII